MPRFSSFFPFSLFLLVLSRWGSYEAFAAVAARLGTELLATHSIFMSTATLFYCPPMGVATAAAMLVGQHLGAGRPNRARHVSWVALRIHALYGLGSGALLVLALRPVWGSFFTHDPAVVQSVRECLPIMALYLFFDHVKCVCMAVLRGCGRAPTTVWGNTLACWTVGFPLAFLFVLRLHTGLVGLWGSMSASWLTACVLYVSVIARTDWKGQVADAARRMQRSMAPVGRHAADKPALSPLPNSDELELELDLDELDSKPGFNRDVGVEVASGPGVARRRVSWGDAAAAAFAGSLELATIPAAWRLHEHDAL